jgi:hypothetical protein
MRYIKILIENPWKPESCSLSLIDVFRSPEKILGACCKGLGSL